MCSQDDDDAVGSQNEGKVADEGASAAENYTLRRYDGLRYDLLLLMLLLLVLDAEAVAIS